MNLLRLVYSLWFPLLLLAAPTTASALPEPLTPDNFDSTIKSDGLWFVEHFSPWCGHCRSFYPTWEKLYFQVDKDAASEPTAAEAVRLRQVDCSVHGDLCDKNGVNAYPTLKLYRAGKLVDTFKGSRDIDRLLKFIKKNQRDEPLAASTPSKPAKIYNSQGVSVPLADKSFSKAIQDADGKAFIKFYAPWCGHCKKLAPAWKSMASRMQNKLLIGEVDCDANRGLCSSEGIEGFPTLKMYSAGSATVFTGPRKMEHLVEFAEQAILPPLLPIKANELAPLVKEQQVLYVLLTRTGSESVSESLVPLLAPLLSQPRAYHITSSSSTGNNDLFKRYSIPDSTPWALIALRDHEELTPASVFFGTSTTLVDEQEREDANKWIETHTLESTVELERSTFQRVMNNKAQPLVVIAAVPPTMSGEALSKLRKVHQQWRSHVGPSGRVGSTPDTDGREVVFSFMDSEQWSDWMKSMYSIKKYSEDSNGNPLNANGQPLLIEDVNVVVADHSRLVFWSTTTTGEPLKLSNPAALFGALQAIHAGQLSATHSENLFERIARRINGVLTGIESFVINHPFQFILVILAGLVLFILFLRRIMRDDDAQYHPLTGGKAPWEREKGGRLD